MRQLLHGSRPIDVGTHHHDPLFFFFLEPQSELGTGRGFTGTLQPGQKNHCWRSGTQIQPVIVLAHELDQLIIDNLDKHLPRRQAFHHFLPQRRFAHLVDEVFHHRQRHIGFQQGQTHFTQGVTNIVFAQTPLATQVFKSLGEFLGQIVKHGSPSYQGWILDCMAQSCNGGRHSSRWPGSTP